METIDIAIIGGGPAGLTAALYAARARATTVVFETGLPGGQIVTTDWVENYPAFPEGVSGAELGELMHRQAAHFGAEFRTFASIDSIEPAGIDFVITNSEDEKVLARAVILATGAVPRRLHVPGEAEFTGRGVSWCATCDGALFRDKVVAVVGGGDAAVEEALFLTKFAAKVYVIHRRDALRATKCIQERCFDNEKIEMKWSRVPVEIRGVEGKVSGIQLATTNGEPDEFLPLDGIFIFVGVEPKSNLVRELVELDESGYVKIDHNGLTSYPGLYAAGDVTVSDLKQVVTAAAGGASAAFEALRYIDERMCSVG
ncbi:MAG: thioredoxin-disulfide reductase [Coriobacteriia bacterium]|nr:thioredoxin-disulfide reductase [Coriobacteriia bacterium]